MVDCEKILKFWQARELVPVLDSARAWSAACGILAWEPMLHNYITSDLCLLLYPFHFLFALRLYLMYVLLVEFG